MIGASSGKVILFGEHAVVHGHPAVAAGLARATEARATATSGTSRLRVAPLGIDVRVGDAHDVARAFAALLTASRCARSIAVDVVTSLPSRAGLGSSASLGVAVARAIDPGAGVGEILARVAAWERVFHGEASGVDATAAALGGCVRFRRGEAPNALPLARPLHLCVVSSGQGRGTRTMVAEVTTQLAAHPAATRATLARIGDLADGGAEALARGDLTRVGLLMVENHAELARLKLTTPTLDVLCRRAIGAGALGAKLTGAGGGGCAVALVEGRVGAAAVLAAWRREGFNGFSATVAAGAAREEAA